MQGDETDSLLTTSVTEEFNAQLQRYLTAGTSVAEAFDKAIASLTDTISVRGLAIRGGQLHFFRSCAIIACFTFLPPILVVYLSYRKEKKEIKEATVGGIKVSSQSIEDTCAYCGGVYIHGIHIKCPHCDAPITPLKTST